MGGNGSSVVRLLCIMLPPSIFLLLYRSATWAGEYWLHRGGFVAARHGEIAGAVVLAWTLLVALAMAARWREPLAEAYGRGFRTTTFQHAVVLLLAVLMLDWGLTFLACLLASLLYWMLAGLVIARRPTVPSGADVGLISTGYLCLACLVSLTAWFVNAAISAL